LVIKEFGLKPATEATQKEVEYRFHRELKLDFFEFIYPDLQYSVFDFKINGYKIQEKVLTSDNNIKIISMVAHLNKHGGTNKAKSPYEYNDNNFYYFHITDKKRFYLIPQDVLLQDGRLKSQNTTGNKKMLLYPTLTYEEAKEKKYLTAEYNKLIYEYDNPEHMEKLKKILEAKSI
jgi:hypothetical protein